MSERLIMTLHPSDTLYTRIEYHSAGLYNTYTIYHPADVRSDVLNDIMSSYNLHNYRIFGLNGLQMHTFMTRSNITYLWNIDTGYEELEVFHH
jgi:muconolactone delta-isomerase